MISFTLETVSSRKVFQFVKQMTAICGQVGQVGTIEKCLFIFFNQLYYYTAARGDLLHIDHGGEQNAARHRSFQHFTVPEEGASIE